MAPSPPSFSSSSVSSSPLASPHFSTLRYAKAREDQGAYVNDNFNKVQGQSTGDDSVVACRGSCRRRRGTPRPLQAPSRVVCKLWASGKCEFGDSCHFRHGETADSRMRREEKDRSRNELGEENHGCGEVPDLAGAPRDQECSRGAETPRPTLGWQGVIGVMWDWSNENSSKSDSSRNFKVVDCSAHGVSDHGCAHDAARETRPCYHGAKSTSAEASRTTDHRSSNSCRGMSASREGFPTQDKWEAAGFQGQAVPLVLLSSQRSKTEGDHKSAKQLEEKESTGHPTVACPGCWPSAHDGNETIVPTIVPSSESLE